MKLKASPALAIPNPGLVCANLSSVKSACSEIGGGLPRPDASGRQFWEARLFISRTETPLATNTFLLSLENLDSVIEACCVACDVCNASFVLPPQRLLEKKLSMYLFSKA